jgi:toxin ParE1/3/4
MKPHKVTFRPTAEADLLRLYDYIVGESGAHVAEGYINRIAAACLALGAFPHRGRARADVLPGLRTIGFERRVLIVFQIKRSVIEIKRVLYGGRNVEMILRGIAEN